MAITFTTLRRTPDIGRINGVTVGDHAIQIGQWRIHEFYSGHLSIVHSGGHNAQIFRSDAQTTLASGIPPRQNMCR